MRFGGIFAVVILAVLPQAAMGQSEEDIRWIDRQTLSLNFEILRKELDCSEPNWVHLNSDLHKMAESDDVRPFMYNDGNRVSAQRCLIR